MRIHPILYGIFVLSLFLGIVLSFQAVGIWSISGKITADGQAVLPSASDVESIKGWMTLDQIATAFDVPLDEILSTFQLPADTPGSAALKDLETEKFSVTNLRTWLQERSLAPTQGITPMIGFDIQAAALTPSPTVEIDVDAQIPFTSAPTEHSAPERTMTGKTTFQNVLDWGVSQPTIEQVLGCAMPLPGMLVKDFVNQNGLDFATVKAALQAEIDKAK